MLTTETINYDYLVNPSEGRQFRSDLAVEKNDGFIAVIQPKTKLHFLAKGWNNVMENQLFIQGQGWQKTGSWKQVVVPFLPIDATAQQIQEYVATYGEQIALDMLGVDFHSFGDVYQKGGLHWQKIRLTYGIEVDTYFEQIKQLSVDFYTELIKKYPNFFVSKYRHYCGDRVWYNGEKYMGRGKFLPYDFVSFHLGGLAIFGWVDPYIDVLEYEKELKMLSLAVNDITFGTGDTEKMLSHLDTLDNTSLRDQIANLSTDEIADRVGDLLSFTPKEK